MPKLNAELPAVASLLRALLCPCIDPGDPRLAWTLTAFAGAALDTGLPFEGDLAALKNDDKPGRLRKPCGEPGDAGNLEDVTENGQARHRSSRCARR